MSGLIEGSDTVGIKNKRKDLYKGNYFPVSEKDLKDLVILAKLINFNARKNK